MSGRPKKRYGKLFRPVYLESPGQVRILLATILITCPTCGSFLVGTYGTRARKGERVEAFTCHDPACPHRQNHKVGRQFVLATSRPFKEEIWKRLQGLYEDLLLDGDKACSVAKKYRVSEAEVSALRAEVTTAIEDQRGLDQLVPVPQPDAAIAIDETFLKVEGKTLFVIIATGYTTHKTLGVRVSATRNEADMRAVFDEAERNLKKKAEVVTSDAHGATLKMTKNLGRPVTHVIHRHKKPYKKVVIRSLTYAEGKRIITDVGVKAGVFKRRGTREYRHLTRVEPLQPVRPAKLWDWSRISD